MKVCLRATQRSGRVSLVGAAKSLNWAEPQILSILALSVIFLNKYNKTGSDWTLDTTDEDAKTQVNLEAEIPFDKMKLRFQLNFSYLMYSQGVSSENKVQYLSELGDKITQQFYENLCYIPQDAYGKS